MRTPPILRQRAAEEVELAGASQTSQGSPTPQTRRWGRRFAVPLLVLVLLGVLLARPAGTWWARRMAAEQLHAGAISAAERWLDRAGRIDPDDYRTELMRAACLRHLGERDAWQAALAAARRSGAPREATGRERSLGALHWGAREQVSAEELQRLIDDGVAPWEAVTAAVYGLLAGESLREAHDLIDEADDSADGAQRAYLRGVCLWTEKRREAARVELEKSLERQPRHEMARASLAKLLEQQDRPSEALTHYVELINVAPAREGVRIGLARVLRKLGRLGAAREVLPAPVVRQGVAPEMAVELAEREYEAGNYAGAVAWFEQANIDGPHVADTLRAAASAFALKGDLEAARRLFARIEAAQSLSRQAGEWQRRLALDPGDRVAARELRRLAQSPPGDAGPVGDAPPAGAPSPLYREHCAACHGPEGDGNGRAARTLFPRPRDFRSGRHRLVSTLNGIATLDDLERVIRRGIPGTSMPAFAELSAAERTQLAREVQQFHRNGMRERLRIRLSQRLSAAADPAVPVHRDAAGDSDEQAAEEVIAQLTTAGEPLAIPPIGPPTEPSVARGREVYVQSGCGHCHGEDGSGASGVPLFDEKGRPTLPRDLVHGFMKGGADGESLYQRIRLGMPGTPHPASATLDEADIIALVHFCQSLAGEPKRLRTNHQRAMRAARRGSAASVVPASGERVAP